MAPRPKNPPPDRRAEILDAALRLFAAKGFEAATNAEIARAAGVTAAALYYYFPNKEELFRAAVREHVGTFVPTVADLTRADRGLESLRELLRRAMDFFTDGKSQMVLKIVLAEGPRRPEIRQAWIDQTAAILEMLTPFIMHAIAAGQIRPVDPRLAFMLLQGPIMSAVVLRDLLQIPFMQGIENDAVVDALLEITLPGLMPNR
ncbi:AcrR family transcriptional regulator [Symbiobacterium terraclitae]|uniref:AcrR family transcriptional regulator n=1 Tax=Symbiobacterium terraclitae TaxID=557451 RepID=A0ABS4JT32_9FIRM|nr:TetR/AcrR family transcriptional regulator [Symbiobacterium terraclitae]MBP2018683.1 AcrR family transcriptional regulator [Symbiobacterium terraclitae]